MKISFYKVVTARQAVLFLLCTFAALICCVNPLMKHKSNCESTAAAANSDCEKIVYLTFDDGPSPVTNSVLDCLDRHNVKASFFVIGDGVKNYPDLLLREQAEGHSIGLHSDSHDYKKIYRNETDFLADLDALSGAVTGLLGTSPRLYRFPGGSSNRCIEKYGEQPNLAKNLKQALSARGLCYVDWNVSGEDSVGVNRSSGDIARDVISQVRKITRSAVVLLHDSAGRETTAEALDLIIPTLKAEGYTFLPLDESVSCRHNLDAW